MRSVWLTILGLLLFPYGNSLAQASKPNIVLIISDDQPLGTVGQFMPQTQKLIFDQGLDFTRAYVTTPSCSPSRSSMLTGQYAAKHGVLVNEEMLKQETIVRDLKEGGYYTGLVGKYLNYWDGSPRSEYDYWVSFKGGSSGYINPQLVVQGKNTKRTGYMTEILGEYANQFVDQAATQDKPFFLIFSPNSPHDPFIPAAQDRGRWSNLKLDIPPSFNEADRSDKPAFIQKRKPFTKEVQKKILQQRKLQLEMLWSLDQAVGSLINKLSTLNLLQNTIVIYISDNGHFWGEHGIPLGKDALYEEAVHVPMAMRYPGLGQPRKVDKLVANIDIAPTILKYAGLPAREGMDGVPIQSLLDQKDSQTRLILLEGYRNQKVRKPFLAVHSGYMVLGEILGETKELYDLIKDPYELNNLAQDPSSSVARAELQFKLESISKQIGRPAQPVAATLGQ